MKNVFFTATQHAVDRLTEVFDLIHPVLGSMWNTKSEVLGLKALYPDITETKLKNRYSIIPELRGANYTRAFLEWDWDKTKMDFAWIILNNIFVVYEGWIKELHDTVFDDVHGDLKLKVMQYPGIGTEINRLTQNKSTLLSECYYNLYKTAKRRAVVPLDNLMYCYRYFKELRNCYVHHGKIADTKLVDAYNQFLPFASKEMLGVPECPIYITPILNTEISVDLRGVIGFSAIIFQIILTCDAELLCSQYAEIEFLARLQNMHRPIKIVQRGARANGRAKVYVQGAGYLEPERPDIMSEFLIKNNLFSL